MKSYKILVEQSFKVSICGLVNLTQTKRKRKFCTQSTQSKVCCHESVQKCHQP